MEVEWGAPYDSEDDSIADTYAPSGSRGDVAAKPAKKDEEKSSASDGFLAWPNGSSGTSMSTNNDDDGDKNSKISHKKKSSGDNGETGGKVTVEFPQDRAPFRRPSESSHKSLGSQSNSRGDGGSANNSTNSSHSVEIHILRQTSAKSLKSSFGSNASGYSSTRSKSGRQRRASKAKIHQSLSTIHSESSVRNSARRNSLIRASLVSSLVKSQQSMDEHNSRQSIDRKGNDEQPVAEAQKPLRRKSRAIQPHRPSLTEMHDENVSALPIVGWDKEIDSSEASSSIIGSFRDSIQKSLVRSMRSSTHSSLSGGKSNSYLKGKYGGGDGSIGASLRDSQHDLRSITNGNGLHEDFVPRGKSDQGLGSSTGPNVSDNDNVNRDLLMMMMQEEYDPRKPWLKPPAGAVVLAPVRSSRRASGMTLKSSFNSDMSLSEIFHKESIKLDNPPAVAEAKSPPVIEGVDEATAVAVVTKLTPIEQEVDSAGDTLEDNTLGNSKASYSVLSDDNSELTELRLANEALFSVPESISVNSELDNSESASSSEMNDVQQQIKHGHIPRPLRDSLSNLDIVQEEQPGPQYHHQEIQKQLHVSPVREHGGAGGGELAEEDLLTSSNGQLLEDLPSSVKNDPFSEGASPKEDDSVSYSDIDADTPHIPSIKSYMTVRDSVIEREFATEQLTDVEFGETKNQYDDNGEMTLEDLLEDTKSNVDDSHRIESAGDTTGSKRMGSKLSSATFKKSVQDKASRLDIEATKNLRRKNKRMWKFCVWNCRKITLCLVLGIVFLGGIASLTWWGATKATGKGDEGGSDGDVAIQVSSLSLSPAIVPTGPESNQWPPVKESGRIPPPLEGGGVVQFPSIAPSSLLRGNGSADKQAANPASEPPSTSLEPSFSLSNSIPTTTVPSIIQNNDTLSSTSPTSPVILNMTNEKNPSLINSYTNKSHAPSESPSPTYLSNINEPFSSSSPSSVYMSGAPSHLSALSLSSLPSVSSSPSTSLSPSAVSSISSLPSASLRPKGTNGASSHVPSSSNPTSLSASPTTPSNKASSVTQLPSPNSRSPSPSIGPLVNISATISYVPSSSNPTSLSASPTTPLSKASSVTQLPSPNSRSPSPSIGPLENASVAISYAPSSSNLPSLSASPTPLPINASSATQPPAANSSAPSFHNISLSPSIVPLSNNANTTTLIPSSNASFPFSNAGTISLPPSSSPSSNSSYNIQLQSKNTSSLPLITTNASSLTYTSIQAISGFTEFEHAGASVSMSSTGEFIAVGFKEANGPAIEKSGLVRVYQKNSDNKYFPLGQDSMFGRATGDEFGASVSISNDGRRVAIGARSSSTLRDKQKNGEVAVFEYSELLSTWVQLGSSIEGTENKERLGFSVSFSGDGNRLAIGSPKGNGDTGSASIHEYDGLDWLLFDDIIVSDGVGDRTGFSVSLSSDGNYLAVGSMRSSKSDLTNNGSASVYKLEGSTGNSPSYINRGQSLVGTSDEQQLGYSIALSGDGQRLVVGSNGFRTANMKGTGLCEVYELQDQIWTKIVALIGNEENEKAGSHVFISEDGNVVTCSRNTFISDATIGAVSVLEENGTGWNILDTIISSFGNSTSFGSSVSLSRDGSMIITGAPSYKSTVGFFELFINFGQLP